MRSVGLDLGVRHISYCEVVGGKVIGRGSVRRFAELEVLLGPDTPPARVAFEACREGWHVHDMLQRWGKEPFMLDTTRIRQIGVGQHRRKNDAIDAEVQAMALDAGRVPLAHVLSPARRKLRAQVSVRRALVATRAEYVTTIRGLARSKGILLPTCATRTFVKRLAQADLDEETRALIAPLVATLQVVDAEIVKVEAELSAVAQSDDDIKRCASAPGIGLIVAATFVSVIDEANRFRHAHAVAAYLGLVPREATTGGPKQRLGSITKQGNTYARAMLVEAAWQIMRQANEDDPLYRWALRIADKRGKRIAVVALARKLACVLWTLWRKGVVYDASFAATKSANGMKRDLTKQEGAAEEMIRVAIKLRKKKKESNLKRKAVVTN
jgi:transposase